MPLLAVPRTLALLAFLCLAVGCGGGGDDEGAGTINVSGEVTFAGKPIPQGKIYFDPDHAKGNSGASGWAEIEDGQFDTSASGGKPTVGGAMIVRIEGFDPSQSTTDAASGETTVKSLFPTYQMNVELPQEDTIQNFEVPADAADKKVGGDA